jgi:Uma2 family endonuclease
MTLPEEASGMTRAEFLAWEEEQPTKHEFVGGEVFSMVGARQIHVVVAGNCFALLKTHLRGRPCRALISDMKLEVKSTDAVFYPDVMVTCDLRDLRAERTLHHPTVIIEVLSESTAAYDRGQKFALYRQIAALQEYALIDPERRTVEVFRRTETGDWLLTTRDSERGLVLRSLEFEAPLAAIFEDIAVDEPGPGQE